MAVTARARAGACLYFNLKHPGPGPGPPAAARQLEHGWNRNKESSVAVDGNSAMADYAATAQGSAFPHLPKAGRPKRPPPRQQPLVGGNQQIA